MPYSVRCKACSAAFAIPDEIWDRRVRGRQATLKCRSCKGDIQVDGTKENAGQPSLPPTAVPAPSSPPQPAEAPAAARATQATAQPSARDVTPSPGAARQAAAAPASSSPADDTATAQVAQAAATPNLKPEPSPSPAAVASFALKPQAKAPTEIAAAETGWSIMPGPDPLAQAVANVPAIPAAPLTPALTKAPQATPSPAPHEASQHEASQHEASQHEAGQHEASHDNREPVILDSIPAEPPSDFWVVSYGDDDDRELTQEQIAAEIKRGKLSGTTIVWRENMPEWLPISGIAELSQYLPAPKLAAKNRAAAPGSKSQTGTSPKPLAQKTPAAPQAVVTGATAKVAAEPARARATSKAASPATSTVPRQPAIREKQPSAPQVVTSVAPTGKSPPPLARATQKSSDKTAADAAASPAAGSRVPQPTSTVPKRKAQAALEASVPYRKAQPSSDEVLTSAPNLEPILESHSEELPDPSEASSSAQASLQPAGAADHALAPGGKPAPLPAVAATPVALPAQRPTSAATVPQPLAAGGGLGAQPQQVAGQGPPKTSFRPPKPTQTETALVMHSTNAISADLLAITDQDFLEMQRRFPKWALPAAISGGVALVGLVIFAMTSGEEPPPLPVAPVMTPSAENRDGTSKHAQPDLDAIPTSTGRPLSGAADKDFASAFAKAAGKGSGSFDPKAAEKAASAALDKAAKCKVSGEPAGQVTAYVTLAPTGQVTFVQVSPPHATSATGKCVEKALRTFSAKPFQGSPAKLSLTVTLR